MAKANKCDRCGHYYDKNERKCIPKNDYAMYIKIHSKDNNYTGLDLCDDCFDALRKFLNLEKGD